MHDTCNNPETCEAVINSGEMIASLEQRLEATRAREQHLASLLRQIADGVGGEQFTEEKRAALRATEAGEDVIASARKREEGMRRALREWETVADCIGQRAVKRSRPLAGLSEYDKGWNDAIDAIEEVTAEFAPSMLSEDVLPGRASGEGVGNG